MLKVQQDSKEFKVQLVHKELKVLIQLVLKVWLDFKVYKDLLGSKEFKVPPVHKVLKVLIQLVLKV